MTLFDILGLLVLAAGGWFLWDSLRVREIANAAMRAACKAEGLLFLDDTVALRSLWPGRDKDGRLRLRRVYEFEFSDTGHNRRRGSVVMLGDIVSLVDIGVLRTGERSTRQTP
jgi:hypothetical protein